MRHGLATLLMKSNVDSRACLGGDMSKLLDVRHGQAKFWTGAFWYITSFRRILCYFLMSVCLRASIGP